MGFDVNEAAGLWIRAFLTFILVSGTGALIWLLINHEIPESNTEQVFILLGVVGTLTTQSCTWWYGSSKGSSDKTGMLKL